MNRRLKRIAVLSSMLVLAVTIYMAWWLFGPHRMYPASIFVEEGEPFYKVVRKLKDRQVVRSPWLFSKIGILVGLDHRVRPGRYDFNRSASNFNVMRKLWIGDIAFMSVTVPEGLTMKQIGTLLHQRCGTDPDIFDSLVRDSQYLASLGVEAGFAEGYLFPETYRFEWGISADHAVRTMVGEMFLRMENPVRSRAAELGYTLHELLTMASIVEREGFYKDEYPTIASVYYNRYTNGMKLQADPTVIYAMGGLDRDLLVKDYQFPSAYNTYVHEGLPPTPICSPGMAAIRAVLFPDSTAYLYFVADGSGRHVFTKTYREHQDAIRRVKGQR